MLPSNIRRAREGWRWRFSLVPLLLVSALAVGGRLWAATPPPAAHIENVPFFRDTTDQCGPSTLASVLSFWGPPVTPAELRPDLYLARLHGTLPMDMAPTARAHGFVPTVKNASFDEVKAEIAQRRPVIAYLNFGTLKHPIGHYVVVTGYDDHRRGLYVHSSAHKDKFVTYRRFDRGWKDTDRWMLVVVPPSESARAD